LAGAPSLREEGTREKGKEKREWAGLAGAPLPKRRREKRPKRREKGQREEKRAKEKRKGPKRRERAG
jgi:hypothetical protein